MSDRVLLGIGALLTVVPVVVATLLARPRPDSVREALYLLLPVAGTLTLVVVAWARL